uniref:Retinol dehydrogenase 14 n=1 Tax=Cacopsylla melanoneura TaxID=428564 RepID=A0A8D8W949_9HEMI
MGMSASKAINASRLDGKTVIITGCNTGIGKVTAQTLYGIGAKVIMACRDVEKAESTATEIRQHPVADPEKPHGEVLVKKLDLASFKSIRECAQEINQSESSIHMLINNAGVMMCPKDQTEDGFELQFGTNHLGHFLFTLLLLPKIIKSAPAKIINLSSLAHERGVINFDDVNGEKTYSSIKQYQQSKLANVLFTKELAERLEGKNVNVYAVHPGIVKTELGRYMDDTYFTGARFLARIVFGWWMKTPEQGAQTTLYCALDETAAKETGLYYSDCKVAKSAPLTHDKELSKKLWTESIKWTKLEDYDPFSA